MLKLSSPETTKSAESFTVYHGARVGGGERRVVSPPESVYHEPRMDPIERLLSLDPGDRGGGTHLWRPGAARRAARALMTAEGCLITTGFVVASGKPETDGPPGAAVLGRALRRVGKAVAYTVDPPVQSILEATLKALGEPVEVHPFPVGAAEAPVAARALLSAIRPTHLIAVERPGRAADGEYYTARREVVSALNGRLDELFLQGRRTVTVGIGDGGNEIGMGAIRRRAAQALGDDTASVVPAQHLVVAGVSNWGAYGVVAYLSLLAGRPLGHTSEEEAEMLHAMVEAGAVDGLTGEAVPTVDGLPLALHTGWVQCLRSLTAYLLGLGPVGLQRAGINVSP